MSPFLLKKKNITKNISPTLSYNQVSHLKMWPQQKRILEKVSKWSIQKVDILTCLIEWQFEMYSVVRNENVAVFKKK